VNDTPNIGSDILRVVEKGRTGGLSGQRRALIGTPGGRQGKVEAREKGHTKFRDANLEKKPSSVSASDMRRWAISVLFHGGENLWPPTATASAVAASENGMTKFTSGKDVKIKKRIRGEEARPVKRRHS